MIRFLFFIAFVAALLVGLNWLLVHPGEVVINWMGYSVSLHIVVLASALVVLSGVVAFFSVLFAHLIAWPARRRARRAQRMLKRGLEQLTRGVTALAMGDEDVAAASLKKALEFLPNEPLPKLLNAQLLQRQGKHTDAEIEFRGLMSHKVTAELATRRLIEQHLERQEWRDASVLVEEARKESPRDRWLLLTLLDLYAREKNTVGMLALTEGWQWQSPLTKPERHRMSALAYFLAAEATENSHKRTQALRHAVGYAPDFLPAIAAYADAQMAEGNPRSARKWLLESWRNAPSPLLIPAILAALRELSPKLQSRMIAPFLRGERRVPHLLLLAHHQHALGEPADAKKTLEELLGIEENRQALMLLADLARETGDETAAHQWLTRAADAPASLSWICKDCGAAYALWQAHCERCTHFDSLHYTRTETRIQTL